MRQVALNLSRSLSINTAFFIIITEPTDDYININIGKMFYSNIIIIFFFLRRETSMLENFVLSQKLLLIWIHSQR